MHLLGAIVEESLHIIPQLRTTHDRVIAKDDALVFQQGRVGNQFHLCHKRTTLLITRGKRARPCGCILQHGTVIGYTLSLSIAQSHTDTRVGHTTDAVDFSIVLLTHHLTILLTHHLNVDAIIVRSGETIIYPQERTDLLALERFLQHLHLIGLQIDDLTRTKVTHTMEIEIRETSGLATHSIRTLLLSNHDRRTSQEVAGCNDTVFREDQHRA